MEKSSIKKVSPRETPDADDFYMGMAVWYASKSKDPHTQVGAVIISSDNRPLGFGYNGPPRQINDTSFSWSRPEKYKYIYHAEENAIDYATENLSGSTLYVSAFPCSRCMLKIVRNGIRKVIYFPFWKKDGSSLAATIADTEEVAKAGYVQLTEYKGNLNWMKDRIVVLDELGFFK